jgi:hypothetical protein
MGYHSSTSNGTVSLSTVTKQICGKQAPCYFGFLADTSGRAGFKTPPFHRSSNPSEKVGSGSGWARDRVRKERRLVIVSRGTYCFLMSSTGSLVRW